MTHVRAQIREAVRARLVGLPHTEGRVRKSRIYSIDELPALLIYITDETSQLDAKGRPAPLRRFPLLRIEAVASTSDDDLDDILDAIAADVEAAVMTDMTFGDLVQRSVLTETEIGFVGEGEQKVGSLRLTYELQYRTFENNPETAI